MAKKTFLVIAGFLLALNIFAWKEVFNIANHGNLKVDFLDVGQGDSVFIETPELHQVLIDGGPDLTVLQKLQELMPFWDRSIDLVVLTHPEKDHMQGLTEVLKRYKVDYVLWTGIVRDNPDYQAFVNALSGAEKNGTKVITDISGKEIKMGNAKIDILYPSENLTGRILNDTSNDSSIVSKLIFGIDSFLFTGDITKKAEKDLINKNTDIKTDVLKVAHHGSKYSTSNEFLEKSQPEFAVISVGRNNSYGHPTSEVLQRLENFGIKVKRTDTDGDIGIVSDGNNIYVK